MSSDQLLQLGIHRPRNDLLDAIRAEIGHLFVGDTRQISGLSTAVRTPPYADFAFDLDCRHLLRVSRGLALGKSAFVAVRCPAKEPSYALPVGDISHATYQDMVHVVVDI